MTKQTRNVWESLTQAFTTYIYRLTTPTHLASVQLSFGNEPAVHWQSANRSLAECQQIFGRAPTDPWQSATYLHSHWYSARQCLDQSCGLPLDWSCLPSRLSLTGKLVSPPSTRCMQVSAKRICFNRFSLLKFLSYPFSLHIGFTKHNTSSRDFCTLL